jgi:hypothetical protein
MAGNVLSVLARVYVDDVDEALPLYQQLTQTLPHRFEFRGLSLAAIPPFLLIAGAGDEVRSHAATVSVRDLQPVIDAIEAEGGTLVEGPDPGPNGRRLIARHPDGNVLEYIELGG